MLSIEPTICAALDPRQLELIILPTEQCNLRCTYCYESFNTGKMSASVIMGLKRLIQARVEDLSLLQLSWFGGEPLLAKDVVFDVTEYARAACDAAGHVEFSANITTNAYYLTPNVFVQLLNAGIHHYQITLDGDQDAHDMVRCTAGGKGTFQIIWGNLLAMRHVSRSFDIMIRAHYSSTTWHATKRLLLMITNEFVGDCRFRVLLKEVSDLGGTNNYHHIAFKEKQKRETLDTLVNICNGRIAIQTDAQEFAQGCYAGRLNSFMVRANGRIGKCTVALDHGSNDIGFLREDGTMQLSREKLAPWLVGLTTNAPSHLSCPLSHVMNLQQK